MLEDYEVCNVMVMVSHWFGGMTVGEARFTYIIDAAKGVLDKGGYLTVQDKSATELVALGDIPTDTRAKVGSAACVF